MGIDGQAQRFGALALAILAGSWLSGRDGGAGRAQPAPIAPPSFATAPAKNGAVIVSLRASSAAATIHYTVDGSSPSASSQIYEAPLLVARNLTVKAVAVAAGTASDVAAQAFSPNIPPGTLVWSDEFDNDSRSKARPNPRIWTYDTGHSGFGNDELEHYCAWGSSAPPCDASRPNAYVGNDGNLHIVAERPAKGVYTSARMKSEGLFSVQYGRVEVRARVPEAQGFWPAYWLLGGDIGAVGWPSCGELDVLERVNAATEPDWNEGSVHGPGFTGTSLGTKYSFPHGQTAAGWHTYGMIWSKDEIAYYVDDPAKPYATYRTASLVGLKGARWPFDDGQGAFLILNLAVGGNWPGSPGGATRFPAQMLVDYVRVYSH